MDPINALPSATPLTADQQAALKKLHAAATQLSAPEAGRRGYQRRWRAKP